MKRIVLLALIVVLCVGITGMIGECEKPPPPDDPTDTTATDTTDTEDTIVYITETGSKFHRWGCQYLKESAIPISRKEAIEQGYTPCKVCKP